LLEDDNPAVQALTAQALGRLGTTAAPAGETLLRLTQAGEANVREHAVRAVAQIQPPQAVAAFLAGLKDAQPEVRKLASAGLIKVAEMPPEVTPALVEALRDPEAQVRANAARVLSRLPELPAESLAPLIDCASDLDDKVRLSAVLALRSAPPARLRDAFAHLLADPNPRLRLLAAGSLLDADPTDPEAAAALVQALADPAPRVRRSALDWIEAHDFRGEGLLEALQQRAESETEPELSDLLAQVIERLERQKAENLKSLPMYPFADRIGQAHSEGPRSQ
jgi:HEAT repeat protein